MRHEPVAVSNTCNPTYGVSTTNAILNSVHLLHYYSWFSSLKFPFGYYRWAAKSHVSRHIKNTPSLWLGHWTQPIYLRNHTHFCNTQSFQYISLVSQEKCIFSYWREDSWACDGFAARGLYNAPITSFCAQQFATPFAQMREQLTNSPSGLKGVSGSVRFIKYSGVIHIKFKVKGKQMSTRTVDKHLEAQNKDEK